MDALGRQGRQLWAKVWPHAMRVKGWVFRGEAVYMALALREAGNPDKCKRKHSILSRLVRRALEGNRIERCVAAYPGGCLGSQPPASYAEHAARNSVR